LKKFCVVLFALVLFAPTAVQAERVVAPAWLVKRVANGDRCRRLEPEIAAAGLPVTFFTYIAYRESRCRFNAINARWDKRGKIVWTLNRNGTYDSGVFQINSSWRTKTREVCGGGLEQLLKWKCNLRMAVELYGDGGLHHWGF
jgi:hypothetical protein